VNAYDKSLLIEGKLYANTLCSCDLGLDPITLIYEFGLDILKKTPKMNRWRDSKFTVGTRHINPLKTEHCRKTDRLSLSCTL